MSFEIQPVQFSDVPQISRLSFTAMYSNKHWRLYWINMTLAELIDYNTQRLPFALIKDNDQRFQKAIDTKTGAIVGYIRWQLLSGAGGITWPEAMSPETSPERRKQLEANYQAAAKARATSINHEMYDPIGDICQKAFSEVIGDEPYIEVDYLTVDVTRQRQGIASLLLEQGLAQADAAGIKCVVMSMPAGVRLYEKHGFVVVNKSVFDDTRWGGDPEYTMTYLIRQPGK